MLRRCELSEFSLAESVPVTVRCSFSLTSTAHADDASSQTLSTTTVGRLAEYHSHPTGRPSTRHWRQRMRPDERLFSESWRMRCGFLRLYADMARSKQQRIFWDVSPRRLPQLVGSLWTFEGHKHGNVLLFVHFVLGHCLLWCAFMPLPLARRCQRKHYVFGLSVRLSVGLSAQILLPRYLTKGLSNLDVYWPLLMTWLDYRGGQRSMSKQAVEVTKASTSTIAKVHLVVNK